jgi:hypothetical protein
LNQTTFIDRVSEETSAQDFLLQRFPKWTVAHWCVTVFAASFLTLALLPEGRLNDFELPLGSESVRLARSLAQRGAFADPFAVMPTGPTAHLAPVYPFLYSVILRLFGVGSAAVHVAWVFNVACVALQLGLLPLVASRIGIGVSPGIVGGVLGTISLYAPIDTRWESFFAGTLLLLAYLLTERSFSGQKLGLSAATGGLWGVVILTNPVAALLLIAWPLSSVCCRARSEWCKNALRLGLLVAAALLVVTPWIARNYARFGTLIFVRDNLGLELYTGNNDCAAPDLETNIRSGCHAWTHPNPSLAVAAQLAAVGEVPFYRAKLREAVDWISTHRRAFLGLTLRRIRLFWFPRAERRWESALVWVITALSLPGLILLAKKNQFAAWVIATAWILFPLIYYFVPFEPRYRYPIYWTSLLPAGYALVAVSRKLASFRLNSGRTNEST